MIKLFSVDQSHRIRGWWRGLRSANGRSESGHPTPSLRVRTHSVEPMSLYLPSLMSSVPPWATPTARSWLLPQPYYFGTIAFFVATTCISLDIGTGITSAFKQKAGDELSLYSIPLFVLTSILAGVAALLYFTLMYVVLVILNKAWPKWYYVLSAILFVLSQSNYFVLSKVICKAANVKVNGSFIATLLETAAVGVLYLAWSCIIEVRTYYSISHSAVY